MGIRNPNASTLRPVKRRSVKYPKIHFEKYFSILFASLQLSSQKKLFLPKKNIWDRGIAQLCP
jgi:hypothetical protein